jgi:tRNA(Ile)-lysidine synthetase-like protein
MHSLAQRVLTHIRRQELLRAGDRVGVAVSGGIDSVALLRVLLELRGELGIVLSVVHFNHRLRGAESDADEAFVAGLAREYDLEFRADGDDVAGHAEEERVSVETAARELRYGFFRHLLGEDDAGDPQGLKPASVDPLNGTAEAVPFHEAPWLRSASLGVDRPTPACLDKILTGHTLDDQAETVIMRMIRGAGLRGLGGIYPRILVEDEDGEFSGEIVRPLLAVRHCDLEQYLTDIGQCWREDSTNTDENFTRNRIRKLVVPLLEREFNPAVAESLAELAEIARGEEDYWENEVAGWMGTTVQWSEPEWARGAASADGLVQIAGLGNFRGGSSKKASTSDSDGTSISRPVKTPTSRAKEAREMGHPVQEMAHPASDDLRSKIEGAPWLVMNASVSRMWFLGEPVAVQRRLVKAIGENAGIPLEFKHVEEILRVAGEEGASGKAVSLPLGWKCVIEAEELVFLTPNLLAPNLATPNFVIPDLREPASAQDRDYEYELPLPGQVVVNEAGSSIKARPVPAGAEGAYNPDHLLDAASLPGPLRVRNWRPGDRFWPAHTKSPKKIKELLQERHVAQQERRFWPVVVSGDQIVWMRGFPVPAKLRATPGRAAILIEEKLLAEVSS